MKNTTSSRPSLTGLPTTTGTAGLTGGRILWRAVLLALVTGGLLSVAPLFGEKT